MATVVMSIEGVLNDGAPGSEILNTESTNSGKVLYPIFRDMSRLLLLSSEHNKDKVKAWLARERLHRYADVHCYPNDTVLSPQEWRAQHIMDLVGIGHHIAFYIDSDPETVKMVLEFGVASILVSTPGVLPGRFEKDQAYSSWYDLVDSIERQTALKASKALESEESDA